MTQATNSPSRSDITQARLIEAAIDAFFEKGFHGTTTRDIAAGAGVSPAALYVHHRSKEELLYLITRTGHEKILRLIEDSIGSSDDPIEALRTLIHAFVVDHAQGHLGARVVNYELAALTPEHFAMIRKMRQQIEEAIRELVTRGVDDGVFDVPDPRITSVALISLGIDIARWYHEGGRWSPEYIGDRYAEMALRIVGARVG